MSSRSSLPYYDAFLAHEWGNGPNYENHHRVASINAALKQKGVLTWFDDDRMHGNISEAMTRGIDKSKKVVVFITERYMNRLREAGTNCAMEFNYACTQKRLNDIIPVVLEKSMTNPNKWKGSLGLRLGASLYIDMSTESLRQKNIGKLCSFISGETIHVDADSSEKDAVVQRMEREEASLDEILEYMDQYVNDPEVQYAACNEIVGRTHNNEPNQLELVQKGAGSKVVAVCTNHPGNARLVAKAIMALSNMSYTSDNKLKLVEYGAVFVILTAMANHPSDEEVNVQGCWSLASLAVNNKNKVSLMNLGATDKVLAAMEKFPHSARLNKVACMFLYNLSLNGENKARLLRSNALARLGMVVVNFQDNAEVLSEARDAIGKINS
mmetsp:Transcript_16025/g.18121  ORF Transcript_16025/g.18121 Transcript_16025/m.18121 type:complete len:383 (+) Transcript_16025:136-1284(+)|eukprot:CAMPEP_0184073888 /NCGR_PEP_ID=MMETSP0957-20130417/66181_1 /TAXON_ID=627963 /ORGANISM="Aplanochytrium sp, Strain PBS07" /LENGTH=382 /DNA_ID=CAMNT_0026375733 /DNA_START=63 /DNA_END=1211 /DNA_ORIENTATION=-